jgi:hypothetical protein
MPGLSTSGAVGSMPGWAIEPTAHGGSGIGEREHELVADLLDHPALAASRRVADQNAEPLHQPGGGIVAHGLGQRSEAGQVDEQDRGVDLARDLRRCGDILGQVDQQVLTLGPLERLAMEVEDRWFISPMSGWLTAWVATMSSMPARPSARYRSWT